ncbi:HNH endonuclease [Vibrio albus]|uniref:HNH endonuclease n=2 Tax=Vibrio albus TaxID=2200953 RepID=A0A2U3BF13_9VIBR|nr:HNH endonuclease [Vibrio albus]
MRPSEQDWMELRKEVLDLDRYRCNICGKVPEEKHIHHIIPISSHGSNHINNLVTLCYKCHNNQHKGFTVTR